MQRKSVRQQDVDDLSGEDMGCDSLKHSGSCMGSQVEMTVFSGRFDSLVGALKCCWTCGVIARKLDHALARKFNPPMHSLLFSFGHASPMCLCLRDFVFVFDVMCFVGLLLCFCVFAFLWVSIFQCLCFCLFVCVFLCLCLCLFGFVFLCFGGFLWVCVCVYVFVFVCMCVFVFCVRLCDFVFLCGSLFAFVSLCLYLHVCVFVIVFSCVFLCLCVQYNARSHLGYAKHKCNCDIHAST